MMRTRHPQHLQASMRKTEGISNQIPSSRTARNNPKSISQRKASQERKMQRRRKAKTSTLCCKTQILHPKPWTMYSQALTPSSFSKAEGGVRGLQGSPGCADILEAFGLCAVFYIAQKGVDFPLDGYGGRVSLLQQLQLPPLLQTALRVELKDSILGGFIGSCIASQKRLQRLVTTVLILLKIQLPMDLQVTR